MCIRSENFPPHLKSVTTLPNETETTLQHTAHSIVQSFNGKNISVFTNLLKVAAMGN